MFSEGSQNKNGKRGRERGRGDRYKEREDRRGGEGEEREKGREEEETNLPVLFRASMSVAVSELKSAKAAICAASLSPSLTSENFRATRTEPEWKRRHKKHSSTSNFAMWSEVTCLCTGIPCAGPFTHAILYPMEILRKRHLTHCNYTILGKNFFPNCSTV